MSTPAAIDALAAFCARTGLDALPAAVRTHAPWVLLDVLGAALGGSAAQPASRLAAACLAAGGAGHATVLRAGLPRSSPGTAAWLNGISAVWLELDPGHRRCRTHAPAHVMPAVLAAAQQADAATRTSGARLLAAFVVGCEIAYRMGGATTPRAQVNAHGTWGVVGATAGAAHVAGLDAATTATALRIAAQLPLATAFASSVRGATVRHAYVGAAAQSALQAIALARAGFTALDDAPDITFGQVLGSAFDPNRLLDGLGSDWEFLRDFAKLHACCHHLYPAIDALQELLAAPDAKPQAIERIVVHTYTVAARLSDPAPATELAAKFSIPYGLAALALHGTLGPDMFRAPHVDDPRLREFAARVEVREDPALSARFPLERPARVELHLRSGIRREAQRHSTHGDYLDPLTPQDRIGKFDALAGAVLGEQAAARIRARVLEIENLPDGALLFEEAMNPT